LSELAQRAAFPRRYRMHAGIPALRPAYMQAPASTRRSTSRSVRYSRPRLPTVTFTEVGAASRSREFSMETALPPVRTVTDFTGRVTDLDGCSSPAPPDIAGGSAGKSALARTLRPMTLVVRRWSLKCGRVLDQGSQRATHLLRTCRHHIPAASRRGSGLGTAKGS